MTGGRLGRLRRPALAAASLASLEAAAFYLYTWAAVISSDLKGPDFFSFYAAARLYLARGGAAVYSLDAQQQFQDQVTATWGPGPYTLLPYIHPPYYTVLIAPLGLMDLKGAYLLWAAVNLLLVAVAALALTRANRLQGAGAFLAVAVLAGFLPLFVTLLQGQSDLVMLAALSASYLAWARHRPGLAGALAGLAMVKPNMLLLVPLLFLARRSWSALGGFAGVAAGLGGVSLLTAGPEGILRYAGIVLPWLVGGTQRWPIAGQSVYSLRGLLDRLPGGRLPALAVLLLLVGAVAFAILRRPPRPRLDYALAVAASVALSPYQNLHDLVLLAVPGLAVASLAQQGSLRRPRLGVAVVVAATLGIDLTLNAGPLTAAGGVILIAGYLLAERLSLSDPDEELLAPGQVADHSHIEGQPTGPKQGHPVGHLIDFVGDQ